MVITGISVSLVNDVIHYITDGKWHMVLSDADFSCWSSNVANVNVVDANIKLIILIAFAEQVFCWLLWESLKCAGTGKNENVFPLQFNNPTENFSYQHVNHF